MNWWLSVRLVDKMEQFVQCQVENQLNVECSSMKQLMEAAVTQEEKVFKSFYYFLCLLLG